MISIKEAQKLILENVLPAHTEVIEIKSSLGRVFAGDIFSDREYPPFNRSAVDGYAIQAVDFLHKNIRRFKVVGEIMAGSSYSPTFNSGECLKIMTGAAVPECADAVIKVEDCNEEKNAIEVKIDSLKTFFNIARQGEDSKANEKIINKGTLIGALHLSLLAAVGRSDVKVFKPLTVAVISTGDELVKPGEHTEVYQIRDSNSYALQGFFEDWKIPLSSRTIAKDNPEALREAFENASSCDIIIFTGGVSMGDADFVPKVLKSAGVQEIFHQVKIRPGKPLWFGRRNNTVVFGLPGNPLSVIVGSKIFIEPYIRHAMGMGAG
ncbi:MAG TPA: molybdopterin molybdotransferase MoeA, partial [Cytophagaceae bacterium]